jgi:HRDC domain
VNTNSMKAKDLVAYALIAVGVVALLGRMSGGAGWLWVGLVAIGFLWAYVAHKSYGFLVTGSILAGVAVGILLESSWGWNGAFLVSLGVGFVMIDRLETRQNKWPLYVGAILASLGLVIGLLETNFLRSFWFALLLIGGGVFLLTRSRGADNSAGWVKVEPQASTSPSAYSASPTTTTSTDTISTATSTSSADSSARDSSAINSSTITSSFDSDGMENQSTENQSTESQNSMSDGVSVVAPTDETVTITPTNLAATTLPLEYDQVLYTRLETWRRETARAEDRAAYLILTNDTMQKIAATKPQTTQELLDIKGIGDVKLERYGEALLKIIKGDV